MAVVQELLQVYELEVASSPCFAGFPRRSIGKFVAGPSQELSFWGQTRLCSACILAGLRPWKRDCLKTDSLAPRFACGQQGNHRFASAESNLEEVQMKRNRWGLRAALTSAGIFACASALPASAQVSIKVLSNRADLISGGDALVEVALPSTLSVHPVYISARLKTTVDGAPLHVGTLALRSDGRIYGLLTGLKNGATCWRFAHRPVEQKSQSPPPVSTQL